MAESLITQVARPEPSDGKPAARKPKLKLDLDEKTLVQEAEDKASNQQQQPAQQAAAAAPAQDADNRYTGLGKIFSRQFTPTAPKSNFFGGDKTPSARNNGIQSPKGGGKGKNLETHQEDENHDHAEEEDQTESNQNGPQSPKGKSLWQAVMSCFMSDPEHDPSKAPEQQPTVVGVAGGVAVPDESNQQGSDAPGSPKAGAPVLGSPKHGKQTNFTEVAKVAAVPEVSEGLLGPRPPGNKKCLVLDLDETLVHSSFKPVPNSDFILSIEMDGIVHKVFVLKRPGVDEFLVRMAEIYEVVIFTASLDKYANPLLDLLDTHKTITGRLYREHCSRQGQMYVKDLSRLGRPLGDTLIIDNSPHSYAMHPTYAVPILSWFDDPHDTELLDMIPFLENLTKVQDVSQVLDASKPWRVSNKKLNRMLGLS